MPSLNEEVSAIVRNVLKKKSFACFAGLEPAQRTAVLGELAVTLKSQKINILNWITAEQTEEDVFQSLTSAELELVKSTLVDRVASHEYLIKNIIKMISTLSDENRETVMPMIQQKMNEQYLLMSDSSSQASGSSLSLQKFLPALGRLDAALVDVGNGDDKKILLQSFENTGKFLKNIMLHVENSPDNYAIIPFLLDAPGLKQYVTQNSKLASSVDRINAALNTDRSVADAIVKSILSQREQIALFTYLQASAPERLQTIFSEIPDLLSKNPQSYKTVETVFSGLIAIDSHLIQYIPSEHVLAVFQPENKRDWKEMWTVLTKTSDDGRLKYIKDQIDIERDFFLLQHLFVKDNKLIFGSSIKPLNIFLLKCLLAPNDQATVTLKADIEKYLFPLSGDIRDIGKIFTELTPKQVVDLMKACRPSSYFLVLGSLVQTQTVERLQEILNVAQEFKVANFFMKSSDAFILSQSNENLANFIVGNNPSVEIDTKLQVMTVLGDQAPERLASVLEMVGKRLSEKINKPNLFQKFIGTVMAIPSVIPKLTNDAIVTIMNNEKVDLKHKLAILSGLNKEPEERLEVIRTAMRTKEIDMKPYAEFFPLETRAASPASPASPTSTIPAEFSPRSPSPFPDTSDSTRKFRKAVAESRPEVPHEVTGQLVHPGLSSK